MGYSAVTMILSFYPKGDRVLGHVHQANDMRRRILEYIFNQININTLKTLPEYRELLVDGLVNRNVSSTNNQCTILFNVNLYHFLHSVFQHVSSPKSISFTEGLARPKIKYIFRTEKLSDAWSDYFILICLAFFSVSEKTMTK